MNWSYTRAIQSMYPRKASKIVEVTNAHPSRPQSLPFLYDHVVVEMFAFWEEREHGTLIAPEEEERTRLSADHPSLQPGG